MSITVSLGSQNNVSKTNEETVKLPCGCVLPINSKTKKIKRIDYDIRKINKDCPLVWSLLERGLTKGVFQLESNLGRQWTKRLKPISILHLAALGAILRPGVLKNIDSEGISSTEHYCKRKNGEEEVTYYHEALKPILKESYSLLIYQEQSIAIGVILAGFTPSEADILRRSIGKKDAKLLAEVEQTFLLKAKTHGILTDEEAKEIFRWVRKSERYGFNKSHSMGYGIESYYTAYAKAHQPLEFLCSYLKFAKNEPDPKDEISELVAEAKLLDIEIGLPTLLRNDSEFYIKKGKIYFGLCNISGIGPSKYKKIKDYLILSETDTWWDCVKKLFPHTSFSIVEKFILAGAFSFLKESRNKMLFEAEIFFEYVEVIGDYLEGSESLVDALTKYRDHLENEVKTNLNKNGTEKKLLVKKLESVDGSIKLLRNPPIQLVDIPAWIAYNEAMLLGTSISCSKVDGCDISDANATCKEFLDGRNDFMTFAVEIERVKIVLTKKDKREMAFLTIKDSSCSVSDVCVFCDVFEEFKEYITEGNLVLIHGEKDKKKSSMIVKSVAQLKSGVAN